MEINNRVEPFTVPVSAGASDSERTLGNAASRLRVAVVHEWLVTYAGSERVLEEILSLYPQADVFAVVDFLPSHQRAFLENRAVKVSFIQRLPLARQKFRWYLPLMPFAVEQMDLSAYDLILSSSHAVSKGVLTNSHQLHISYVHTPIRYAWDLQEQYLQDRGVLGRIKVAFARVLMHYLRIWDLRTANGVDLFIANSEFVARRIMKTYRRAATVLYPPVNVEDCVPLNTKDDFYICVTRLVPYKRVDLLLEAFAKMPQQSLLVIGGGPDLAMLRSKAPPNVTFLGVLSDAEVRDHLARAKAFVYAGEEDFGIAMVEAQAWGTPVLAFARGGASEIVLDGKTGLLFDRQTPEAIILAVSEFERHWRFDPSQVHSNAMRFNVSQFRIGFKTIVNEAIRRHWMVDGAGRQPKYPLCASGVVLPTDGLRMYSHYTNTSS
jgi:glycosyltransferase involved in cell wall biosynthesis